MYLYLIFHYGRCGSTVLADLLAQQSSIISLGEICNQTVNLPWVHNSTSSSGVAASFNTLYQGRNDNANWSIDDFQTFLDGTLEALDVTNKSSIFFEVKHYDFNRGLFGFSPSILFRTITDKYQCGIIHLHRHNLLGRFVSERLAERSKIYHVRRDEHVEMQTLEIDLEQLEKYIFARLIEHYSIVNSLMHYDVLDLVYERDIEVSPSAGAAKVCSWAGISYSGGDVRFERTNPFDAKAVISNFEAVALLLERLGFHWMLAP